jgi:hypothetical protein
MRDYAGGMNIRFMPNALEGAAPLAPRKIRFNPRADVLDEVVAGFLWMQLNLPERVSRTEIQQFAHRLVTRIKARADQSEVEREIRDLQYQFCRPADPAAISDLARRSLMAVTGL